MGQYLYYPGRDGLVLRVPWNGTVSGVMAGVRRAELIDTDLAAEEAVNREIRSTDPKRKVALTAAKAWLSFSKQRFPFSEWIDEIADDYHGVDIGTHSRERQELAKWMFVCLSVAQRQPALQRLFLDHVKTAANIRKAEEAAAKAAKEEKRQDKIAEVKAKRSHKKKP